MLTDFSETTLIYFDILWLKTLKKNVILTHWNEGILFHQPWITAFIFTANIFLIASYLCFLEGLINIPATSLRPTIYLYILCLIGWKHSSRKQLSRHDDNKPSVAGIAGKEVALSKQYFPKQSRAVCQAVTRLSNYFRYSFFIWSLEYNFLMWNTSMIYGFVCFFPWKKLCSTWESWEVW